MLFVCLFVAITVGLSKKVKPPRLSDPGPTQMTLGAFAFSK